MHNASHKPHKIIWIWNSLAQSRMPGVLHSGFPFMVHNYMEDDTTQFNVV